MTPCSFCGNPAVSLPGSSPKFPTCGSRECRLAQQRAHYHLRKSTEDFWKEPTAPRVVPPLHQLEPRSEKHRAVLEEVETWPQRWADRFFDLSDSHRNLGPESADLRAYERVKAEMAGALEVAAAAGSRRVRLVSDTKGLTPWIPKGRVKTNQEGSR